MARNYKFTLPEHISGLQDSVGISDLQDAGLWNVQDIPADLQQRMQANSGLFGSGLDVSAADLNRLSDRAWSFIATRLNLQWSAV